MNVNKLTGNRALQLGLAATLVAGGISLIAAPAQAVAVKATLAPATGAGGADTSTTITVTGSGFTNAAKASQISTLADHGVVFNSAACATDTRPGSATATILDASSLTISSATKLIVKTPALGLGTADASKAWNLCIYAKTAVASKYPLIASGAFTVYPRPTIDATTPIAPTSGTVSGGETVTITGTGFTAKTTAKVGDGSAAKAFTNIKVTGTTSFTATVPAGSGDDNDLVVTTEGGASITKADVYNYANAVTVSPSTGHDSGDVDDPTTITINGLGFEDTFADGDAPGVVFVQETWDGSNQIETVDADDVTVVSDSEIVFNLPTGMADGAYSLIVASDTADEAGDFATIVSSGATYTVSDF